MAAEPAPKPLTVDTVSAYTPGHLKAICPDIFKDDRTSKVSTTKIKTNIEHLTEFACSRSFFSGRKTKSGKYFSKLRPRMISINLDNSHAGIRTKVLALYHVNRDTRRDTLKLYGYVALEHPETPQTTLFHPEIDLLYITKAKRVSTPSSATAMNILEASGALHHISCIACSMYVSDFDEYLAPLLQCTSLEVLLLVWNQDYLDEQTKAGRLPRFYFGDMESSFT